jgi:CTP:molybdopterin cytidylyltransferase MocA
MTTAFPPISVDTIILAGGRNERLRGVVPTAHKPLIVMNGETLIGRLVRQSILSPFTRNTIVVVSPINAQPISDIVPDASIIVQPRATGPEDALRLGTRLSHDATHVLLLCADNYMSDATLHYAYNSAIEHPNALIMGTRSLPAERARRFTRVPEARTHLIDAHHGPPDEEAYPVCWIGPVLMPRKALMDTLTRQCASLPCMFTDMLQQRLVTHLETSPSDAQDVGVPDELPAMSLELEQD